jgi:hypothetical protein
VRAEILRARGCDMERRYWKPEQLILVRSDAGDSGWSLHAPWATADQIANGDEPPLQSGTADYTSDGEWARPDRFDYARAMNVLSARDKCKEYDMGYAFGHHHGHLEGPGR